MIRVGKLPRWVEFLVVLMVSIIGISFHLNPPLVFVESGAYTSNYDDERVAFSCWRHPRACARLLNAEPRIETLPLTPNKPGTVCYPVGMSPEPEVVRLEIITITVWGIETPEHAMGDERCTRHDVDMDEVRSVMKTLLVDLEPCSPITRRALNINDSKIRPGPTLLPDNSVTPEMPSCSLDPSYPEPSTERNFSNGPSYKSRY